MTEGKQVCGAPTSGGGYCNNTPTDDENPSRCWIDDHNDETTKGSDNAESDEFNQRAADLVLETNDKYQENLADQEEFLDTVADESDVEVLETQCNLIGEYVVPLKAKLNGEVMERMEALDDRMSNLSTGDARVSETADEVSQLLADLIDDPEYNKDLFYKVYLQNDLGELNGLLDTAFKSLKTERKRRRGTADGFRGEQPGA